MAKGDRYPIGIDPSREALESAFCLQSEDVTAIGSSIGKVFEALNCGEFEDLIGSLGRDVKATILDGVGGWSNIPHVNAARDDFEARREALIIHIIKGVLAMRCALYEAPDPLAVTSGQVMGALFAVEQELDATKTQISPDLEAAVYELVNGYSWIVGIGGGSTEYQGALYGLLAGYTPFHQQDS